MKKKLLTLTQYEKSKNLFLMYDILLVNSYILFQGTIKYFV